jgi:hypothetical protein
VEHQLELITEKLMLLEVEKILETKLLLPKKKLAKLNIG